MSLELGDLVRKHRGRTALAVIQLRWVLSLDLHIRFIQTSKSEKTRKVNVRVITDNRKYSLSIDGGPRHAVIGVEGRKRQVPTELWTFQSRALLEKERTKTSCSIQLTIADNERPS